MQASRRDVTPAQAARSCGHNDTVTGKSTAGREALTARPQRRGSRALAAVAGALVPMFCLIQSKAGQDQQNFGAPDKNSRHSAAQYLASPFDAWRIVHTKAADGVTETTAILRVADVLKSDPRLAGLMLRCTKQGIEPVIVVVEPFSPQARPKITLRADDQELYFEGKPLPTGAGLRIPADGLTLISGPWRGAPELRIGISEGGAEMSGVVDLAGLTQAIQSLDNCAGR
jgi:hypothetical protein